MTYPHESSLSLTGSLAEFFQCEWSDAEQLAYGGPFHTDFFDTADDHVDLWQLHDIGLPEDGCSLCQRGAMEALREMQEQKVVRFLGVTGH